MNATLKTLLAAGILVAASPALACDYPARPDIPDGGAATRDEMLAASGDVKEYIAKVDAYLNCIEDEAKADLAAMEDPPEEEIQRRTEMLDKRFEAANEEKALVGEMFNQQVRAYNAKRQESNGE